MGLVEAEVFGHVRPRLLGPEEQLPYVFVCRAEEPLQGLRTGRIELPHVESPALARENPAKKHHLDHAGEAGVLVYHALDAALQRRHLVRRFPIQTLINLGCKPHRGPDLNSGAVSQAASWGFMM